MMRTRWITRRSAVAACAALLAGCAGVATTGQAAPSSAAPTAPQAVASPPPVAAADGAAAASLQGLDGASLAGVAAGGAGMVAVGSVDGDAAAWTSSDGAVWRPLDVTAAGQGKVLQAVAVTGDGVLAFGGTDAEPSQAWRAAEPAGPWEPGGAAGIDGRVHAVVGENGQWVAVGDLIDAETGTATSGAAWTSDDGTTWRRVATMQLNEGTVSDVAVVDDTTVVVGFDVDGGRVWTATGDARPAPVDTDAFAAATIQGVAAVDGRFVALGRGLGELQPLLWTSEDGTRWERQEVAAEPFPPEQEFNELATVDGELVAVGAGPAGGAVWTSTDGTAWIRRH